MVRCPGSGERASPAFGTKTGSGSGMSQFTSHGRKLKERNARKSHILWWARRDSNPQPRDYESPALTVELQARKCS